MDTIEKKLEFKLFTIGVYGYSEDAFFDELLSHKIDLFIDIRARRKMSRWSSYGFVNKTALINKLGEIGIEYVHLKQLAPTDEIRALQHQADKTARIRKRDRTELSEAYKRAYRRDILKNRKQKEGNKLHVLQLLTQARENAGYTGVHPKNMVLFCVEGNAKACHRSLAYKKFNSELKQKGYEVKPVKHLKAK